MTRRKEQQRGMRKEQWEERSGKEEGATTRRKERGRGRSLVYSSVNKKMK